MTETTKEYFDREKESRILLSDYLDEDTSSFHKVELAQKILWGDINDLLYYDEEDDVPHRQYINPNHQDWEQIDGAVRNAYEPLSIKKYVSVNPRSNEVDNVDDCTYLIQITLGWPNVYWDIDRSAELHLYWWSEHYSRDFGGSFVDKLLSFYWLEQNE